MANYLTVNDEKKTVILDRTLTPDATDEMLLNMYVNKGYKVRVKSQARAKAMADKADHLTEEKVLKLIEGKPELIEKYNTTKALKGFIAAKEEVKEALGLKEKKDDKKPAKAKK